MFLELQRWWEPNGLEHWAWTTVKYRNNPCGRKLSLWFRTSHLLYESNLFSVSSQPEFLSNNVYDVWRPTGTFSLESSSRVSYPPAYAPSHSPPTVQTSSDAVSQCLWPCSASTMPRYLLWPRFALLPLTAPPMLTWKGKAPPISVGAGRLPCLSLWSPHSHQ